MLARGRASLLHPRTLVLRSASDLNPPIEEAMTETLRRTAFGALALLLGFAPLACASAPAPSPAPSPATPKQEEKKDEKKKGEPVQPTGPTSEPESRKNGETPYASLYQPLPSQTVLVTN